AVAVNAVGQQNNAITAKKTVAQGRIDAHIGGHACDDQCFHAARTKLLIQIRLVETAERMLVDDQITLYGLNLEEVRSPTAFQAAALFAALLPVSLPQVLEIVDRTYPDNRRANGAGHY